MLIRGVIALVMGAVAGVGIALASQPAADRAAADRAPPCESRRAAARVSLESLDDQLSRAERELFAARLRRAAILGMARPWPDDPSPLLEPEALRAHLEAAVADGPGQLVDLDCAAYPCVATLSWELLPEDEGLIANDDGTANMPGRLLAQLQGDSPYAGLPFFSAGRMHSDRDGVGVFGMTFYDPADYKAAKAPDDLESAQLNGTVLDQIRGRTSNITDGWSGRALP
jgi:hypothetical protein